MKSKRRIASLLIGFLVHSPLCALSQQVPRVLVSGFVTDAATTERIPAATISVDGKPEAMTDSKGYFQLFLLPRTYILRASHIAYDSSQKAVELRADQESIDIFFALNARTITLDSVTVTGTEIAYEKYGSPLVPLSAGDMASVPRFAEPDPVRLTLTLPGVTSSDFDYISQISLRGGNFDETMIALDGVPVYNPYHFAGWFSMFSTDILKREELFRSNYPVNLSGYLSGALNMVSKNGSTDRHKGITSAGVSSASVVAEGPLLNGSYVVSARRIWLDMLFNLIKRETMPYYFYDLYGKYLLPVDEGNLFEVSFFLSRDVLNVVNDYNLIGFEVGEEANWTNRLVHALWTHIFSKDLRFSISAYDTKSSVAGDVSASYVYEGNKWLDMHNGISERGLKVELESSSNRNTTLLGAEIRELSLGYQWDVQWARPHDPQYMFFPRPSSFFDYAPNNFQYEAETRILSAYGSQTFNLIEALDVTLGYRLSHLSHINSLEHSPFVSLSYTPATDVKLRAGYGKYYQQLYVLKEARKEESVFSAPYAVRFLAENSSEVARSHHYSVGINIDNLVWNTSLDMEAYYKVRHNLPATYFDTQALYTFEDGYTTGVDVLLKRTEEPFSGWVGYSLSRSVKRNPQYEYFSNADRTHSLKLVLGYKLFEELKVDVFWTFATGVPYTDLVGKYVAVDREKNYSDELIYPGFRAIEGRKNSARNVLYHRLDVGFTGYFVWGDALWKPYLQVFNAYNAANPFLFDWKSNPSKDAQRGSYIMPTFGVTVEF